MPKCVKCQVSAAFHELIGETCHKCTAKERDELKAALNTIRDSVLHERGPLAELNPGSDTINAVLGIIDDNTPTFK